MKGEWTTGETPFGDGKYFCTIYRLRDCNAVNHSGNHEYPNPEIIQMIERKLGRKLNHLDSEEISTAAQILNHIGDVDVETAEKAIDLAMTTISQLLALFRSTDTDNVPMPDGLPNPLEDAVRAVQTEGTAANKIYADFLKKARQ